MSHNIRCLDAPLTETEQGVTWHSWNGHTWCRGEPCEETRRWGIRESGCSTIEEGGAPSPLRSSEEDYRTHNPSESVPC
jgi:hypothetical protein